jgi:hypothetical protein
MIRGRERKTLYERDALEPWRERRERISEVQVDTRKIKVQEERADKDRELQRGRDITYSERFSAKSDDKRSQTPIAYIPSYMQMSFSVDEGVQLRPCLGTYFPLVYLFTHLYMYLVYTETTKTSYI